MRKGAQAFSRAVQRVALIGLACQELCLSSGAAQVRASQPGKVAQTVDGTTISVEYSRPVARGRELFGGVVRWNDAWTPGANWATTIEVDKEVRLNNQLLPIGRYSIWVLPRQNREWTVWLSRVHRVLHLWPPLPDQELLHFDVRPQQAPHVEVLTWSFPAVMRDGTILRMQWGTTLIQFRFSVEISRPVETALERKAAFTGHWTLTFEAGESTFAVRVAIVDANGQLQLRGHPLKAGFDSYVDLVPIGGDEFHPLFYKGGQPSEIDASVTLVCQREGDNANSFEVRDADDRTLARGVRIHSEFKGKEGEF
jgi:hypothetical protein